MNILVLIGLREEGRRRTVGRAPGNNTKRGAGCAIATKPKQKKRKKRGGTAREKRRFRSQ